MKSEALSVLGWIMMTGVGLCGPWIAEPELLQGGEREDGWVSGRVFYDEDGNGRWSSGEVGVEGVKVTNGRDVVVTDGDGRYRIAVRDDMDLSVVQPSGWRVPVNERWIPQYFYVHKPGGTPETLRFGGLPDTGPAPAEVNFPLRPTDLEKSFGVAVVGDPQTYSNDEVGYMRDGLVRSLLNDRAGEVSALLAVGDVLGDDLELLPRFTEICSMLGVPLHFAFGNHDIDFDATDPAHSADSWRRFYGPSYYAFEMGEVLFIVLNNVRFPAERDERGRARYNGIVDDNQMEWLANLLSHTPEDRLIVLAHHIPFVSFADMRSPVHQTDNVAAIHQLLDGRSTLSVTGHTHTTENHAPGQHFDGWSDLVNVGPLPFRHLVVGASSGAWYQGDFNTFGLPMALQRDGAPPGYFRIQFEGSEYAERYVGIGFEQREFWVDFNTPAFREWHEKINEWVRQPVDAREATPPYSINDLRDTRLWTREDLEEGVFLFMNVWGGSAETRVTARINGGEEVALERTQAGEGEPSHEGAEWVDPFAAKRQLSVARYAFRSMLGTTRSQGWEATRGNRHGPADPQPMRSVADRGMHFWRMMIPNDLPVGVHRVDVESVDRHGRISREAHVVEVREELPPRRWRHGPWQSQ